MSIYLLKLYLQSQVYKYYYLVFIDVHLLHLKSENNHLHILNKTQQRSYNYSNNRGNE